MRLEIPVYSGKPSLSRYINFCHEQVDQAREQAPGLHHQYVYRSDRYEQTVTPEGTRITHHKGGPRIGVVAAYVHSNCLYLGHSRVSRGDCFETSVGLYRALRNAAAICSLDEITPTAAETIVADVRKHMLKALPSDVRETYIHVLERSLQRVIIGRKAVDTAKQSA